MVYERLITDKEIFGRTDWDGFFLTKDHIGHNIPYKLTDNGYELAGIDIDPESLKNVKDLNELEALVYKINEKRASRRIF